MIAEGREVPAPDDFGMTPQQALAHVADRSIPPGFLQYWSNWAEEVWTLRPVLRPHVESGGGALTGRAAVPGVTHTVESTRGVRLGCRVTVPARALGSPRGVVVRLHGYEVAESEPLTDAPAEGLIARGVAVIQVRVRGFPGSCFDVPNLSDHPTGYITHGLERPDEWILPRAVADVVTVARAALTHFGPATPLGLWGESFGAGLAVIAAAQLVVGPPWNSAPALTRPATRGPYRMAIGLPSLGDWSFRLRSAVMERSTQGVNHEIARFITLHRREEHEIRRSLAYLDAALHARRVMCPVLCKLALRDDVVPAPAAAAVYNALGTDPARKWRLIMPYGHYDGGLANARQHALFDRAACEFLDPAVSPEAAAAQHASGAQTPVMTSR